MKIKNFKKSRRKWRTHYPCSGLERITRIFRNCKISSKFFRYSPKIFSKFRIFYKLKIFPIYQHSEAILFKIAKIASKFFRIFSIFTVTFTYRLYKYFIFSSALKLRSLASKRSILILKERQKIIPTMCIFLHESFNLLILASVTTAIFYGIDQNKKLYSDFE